MMKSKYRPFIIQFLVGFVVLSVLDYLFFKDFRLLKNLIMSLTLSGANMYFMLKKEKKEKED
jgi:type III secretory pathway component EscU